MAEIAGSPWRGLTKIQLDGGGGNRRNYVLSVADLTPDTATGNQADWEGNPGTSFVLRLEWDTVGLPVFGEADTCNVYARLPGDGVDIGSVWSPAIAGASGSATRTVHFDSDPLDQSPLNPDRSGMIELVLEVQRVAAVAWGKVDSRGAGTPPAATTLNWARGYWRAPVTLSAYSVSNASLGGAEPASFAFPDSVFWRFTLDVVTFRSVAFSVAARQSSTDRRTDAGVAQTAAARDYTWDTTATTVAGKGRVNNGQWTVGSTATDVRITVSSNVFGGTTSDKEYAWATSGHPAGFAVSGDNLTHDARITVDPRITFSQVMQIDNVTFQTPPTRLSVTTRKASELGSLIARAVNSRSEGTNSLAWTEKLWDAGELVSSEASLAKTRSTTSQTQGGQAGWSDAFLNWDNQLPTGTWLQKEVVVTADATGLELTNSRTVTLIGADKWDTIAATAEYSAWKERYLPDSFKTIIG